MQILLFSATKPAALDEAGPWVTDPVQIVVRSSTTSAPAAERKDVTASLPPDLVTSGNQVSTTDCGDSGVLLTATAINLQRILPACVTESDGGDAQAIVHDSEAQF